MRFFRWWRRFGQPDHPDVPLFCECNDVDCLMLLPIDEQIFLDTRVRQPGAAIVLVGHEDDTDNVLERHEGYLVVQPIGS